MRAEKLLSSAAKIVFLIIHQLRLYTGLMANSTSDLLLVNSISKEMLSLQTQEPLSELVGPATAEKNDRNKLRSCGFLLGYGLVGS